jgi:hypothetical protein
MGNALFLQHSTVLYPGSGSGVADMCSPMALILIATFIPVSCCKHKLQDRHMRYTANFGKITLTSILLPAPRTFLIRDALR